MKARTEIIRALEYSDIGWSIEKLKQTLELDEPIEELKRILKALSDNGYVTAKHKDRTYYYRTAKLKGYLENSIECPHCHDMYHKFGALCHIRICPLREDRSSMTENERANLIDLLQRYRRDTAGSLEAIAKVDNPRMKIQVQAKEELIVSVDTVLANLGANA